jgi:hypothetical protein
MKRFGLNWCEKTTKSEQIQDEGYWIEGWYTDITLSLFPIKECRFCITKYDGQPYFLIIFLVLMFRFGKYGHWD